jgi:hypothetical protein
MGCKECSQVKSCEKEKLFGDFSMEEGLDLSVFLATHTYRMRQKEVPYLGS